MNKYNNDKNPIVTIEMTTGEKMKLELYPTLAPESVKNFIALIKAGFYDGLTFHRVIRGFMIQGGCPDQNGMGGPGYNIKGEFASNSVENDLSHTRGVLSMARSIMPDSAGSQFFIMHKDSPHLDGQYAAFGMVIDGLDTVDMIAETECNDCDKPLVERKIAKMKVNAKGVRYSAPKKL